MQSSFLTENKKLFATNVTEEDINLMSFWHNNKDDIDKFFVAQSKKAKAVILFYFLCPFRQKHFAFHKVGHCIINFQT